MQVVYVARNPKDVIVSYFFHHKLIKIHGFSGDIEQFAQFFMDDEGILVIVYKVHPKLHFFFLFSYVFSFLPSRSRSLVQTTPSKHALHVLRGHEKGKSSNLQFKWCVVTNNITGLTGRNRKSGYIPRCIAKFRSAGQPYRTLTLWKLPEKRIC